MLSLHEPNLGSLLNPLKNNAALTLNLNTPLGKKGKASFKRKIYTFKKYIVT